MARKYVATCEHCDSYSTPGFDSEQEALDALDSHEQNECINRIREETRVIGRKAVAAATIDPTKWAKGQGVVLGTIPDKDILAKSDRPDIRTWLRENGYPNLGERGRIPVAGTIAYQKAFGIAAAVTEVATANLTAPKLERTPVKKASSPYLTNFCIKCSPDSPSKMHAFCKGTIHNALPNGGEVVCSCPNHEVA